MTPYEDPRALMQRTRLWREEYCQRLLTMLVVGGAYPRWNTRTAPCATGVRFLAALEERSFGAVSSWEDASFVDEFRLKAVEPGGPDGYPDYAVLRPGHLWLIELKTEAGSHRPGQLPYYSRLARHHFPEASVHVTYLTPPMRAVEPELQAGQRYAHVTWDELAVLVRSVWGDSTDPRVERVRDGLLEAIASLPTPVAAWRAGFGVAPVSAGPDEAPLTVPPAAQALTAAPLTEVLDAARKTASDGAQRAVVTGAEDLEALQAQRDAVGALLAAEPALRHVQPWLWDAASSGGRALTAEGQEHGFELRLSRYAKPVR